MQKYLRENLIAALSVIGFIAAVYLSVHYYDIHAGTAGFKSLCNINSSFDCDAVATSRYAQVFGLPLSSFVAGWFLTLFFLSFFMRSQAWRREAIAISTAMSVFGSLYSVALIVVMSFMLKKFCLFCLVIDAVNFLQLAILFSIKNQTDQARFKNLNLNRLQTGALLWFISSAVMIVLLKPAGRTTKDYSSDDTRYLAQQVLDSKIEEVKTPKNPMIIGPENAPLTVFEFSDFQCPFCKRGAVLMHTLQNKYPDKIKVIFMGFPLDSACNRKLDRPMHPYACALSRAAYCAHLKGKFLPVYEEIFDDQESLNANSAHNTLVANAITEDEAKKCIASEDAKKAVEESIEEGIRLNVSSTPTFFLNGRRVDGTLPLEAWEIVIEALIKK